MSWLNPTHLQKLRSAQTVPNVLGTVIARRWATKKAGGSTKNGRDSMPKYLGIKKYGGEAVEPGHVITRQRGTKWHMGKNVGMGKDHTLFSLVKGKVSFRYNKHKRRGWIDVTPDETVLVRVQ